MKRLVSSDASSFPVFLVFKRLLRSALISVILLIWKKVFIREKSEGNKMFREMRRNKQSLSEEEVKEVLERRTSGVLACLGDDGYPYAVPVSYIYFNGKIYFHSAKTGHKIDAIEKYPKVSFTVIDEDTVVSEKYTTYFRSVIAFGKARITEGVEMVQAFIALTEKYSGNQPEEARKREVAEGVSHAYVIAIDVEHITGKEAKDYAMAKRHQE